MNDREALVATMRTAYRTNKMLGIDTGTDTPARIAMYVTDDLLSVFTDAIIAAGWREPEEPHEHEWVDPRDLITPPDMCAVCQAWRPPDEVT